MSATRLACLAQVDVWAALALISETDDWRDGTASTLDAVMDQNGAVGDDREPGAV